MRFIKFILQSLESLNAEICEEWYTLYTIGLSINTDSDIIYRHYCCPKLCDQQDENTLIEPCISLAENMDAISQGQTGFRTWGASLEAVNWICQDLSVIKGKRIGEIGSGSGLLGLFCSFLGAESVVLSDVEELRDRILVNISLNKENIGKANCVTLDWEGFNNLPLEFKDLELLVAADVIYDPILIPHLVRVLWTFLSMDQSRVCFISQTIRQESTIDLFKKMCQDHNLSIELIHQKGNIEDLYFHFSESSPIHIYRLNCQDTVPKQTTISDSKDKLG